MEKLINLRKWQERLCKWFCFISGVTVILSGICIIIAVITEKEFPLKIILGLFLLTIAMLIVNKVASWRVDTFIKKGIQAIINNYLEFTSQEARVKTISIEEVGDADVYCVDFTKVYDKSKNSKLEVNLYKFKDAVEDVTHHCIIIYGPGIWIG